MRRLSTGLVALSVLAAAVLFLAGCGTAQIPQAGGQQSDDIQTPATAAAQDLPSLVAGNTSFTLDLFKTVRSDSANVVLSPYSISTALAMTYAGANGLTATQMAGVLHFTVPKDRLPAVFQQLAQDLSSGSQGSGSGQDFQISIANSIWGQQDFAFLPAFLKVLQQQFDSPLRKVDFAKSAESARQTINDWAKEETKGKIPDLLPVGSIDAATRMVLANAVYFKADWLLPFAHEDTSDREFQLANGKTTTVPMMSQTATFGYVKTGGWEAVELPYQGGRYSMVALLPQSRPHGCAQGIDYGQPLHPPQTAFSCPDITHPSQVDLQVRFQAERRTDHPRHGKCLRRR